ncbi:Hypothetical predicted protein [Olea europaea subsp. europaea]|uniref:Uncharacterized protein n=1 Tax=Olea europaea subsp. europaea TaxID=158383 RepID=A0A8S0SYP7_OLEEU|nr:Hypothetical predicted protein [Olea europaea subsp. europaea]
MDNDNIKAILTDIFLDGMEKLVAATDWAIVELLRNVNDTGTGTGTGRSTRNL